MGTKLEEGVELKSLECDPPMAFTGTVDGKRFGLFWYERDWMFFIAEQEEHLYVDRSRCVWHKNSQHPIPRPQRMTQELVVAMKAVIHSCVEEWRVLVAQKP